MTTATKTRRANKSKTNVSHEQIVNDAPRRFSDAEWPVGSAAAQGDVYLMRIDKLPTGAKPRTNRQIAEGNTQGSRHIVHGGQVYDCDPSEIAKAVKKCFPKCEIGSQYFGPVIVTDDSTALRHPEHGDHEYCQRGMVIVSVIQRSLDAEQREQLARD